MRQFFRVSKTVRSYVIANLLIYSALIISLGICLIAALTSAIYVPTFHLDGAFQTASGLFRLESGQLPGKDFYPYLGVGPLFSIFPMFIISNGDLASTVTSASFTTLVLTWLSVATLWHFILRPNSFLYSAFGASMIVFAIEFICRLLSLDNPLAFGYVPGNSLRPVRAALPYLVALPLYYIFKNRPQFTLRNSSISTILGMAMLWSNDFSVPTFGIFFIFSSMYFWMFENRWKISAFYVLVVSITLWMFLLYIITAGHSLELLKYNFLDVAKDQWWYFAPYDAQNRIFEFTHFVRLLDKDTVLSLVVLVFILFFAIKKRRIELFLVFAIGTSLFAGGCLASIGGHIGGYFGGFHFWSAATFLILVVSGWKTIASRFGWRPFLGPRKLQSSGLAVLVLIVSAGFYEYRNKLAHARADPNLYYVEEFGAFLDVDFREYIQYARQNGDSTVVEEYWGLWSTLNGVFPPWPVDSIIHALGKVRDVSRDSLIKADAIITTRHEMSPIWQPWNLSQSYWFYEDLIANWDPDFISPNTIVWKRSRSRAAYESTPCQVANDRLTMTLPDAEPGYYKLTVGYASATHRGWRHLLMIRNNISFGGDARGFVSLEPGKHTATFPALLSNEVPEGFDLKVIGDAEAEILSCTAEKILHVDANLFFKVSPQNFFNTDDVWEKGIARNWPGFFTFNTEENFKSFTVGAFVVFPDGQKRQILLTRQGGPRLIIWLDGESPLPGDIGFPTTFTIEQ
jgi:hypothetical protein